MSRRFFSAFRAVLLLTLATSAEAAPGEAGEWLQQMVDAIQQRNYTGTFVYVHGDQVETMGVVHRVNEEGERERLFALTGAAREVLRDNESVTCILPDDEAVMVSASRPRSPFRSGWLENLDRLPESYNLKLKGPDRVAGRDARMLAVEPKDGYRYGYMLWLDESSHLLLKSNLLDEEGEVVEQVIFTALELPEHIPDSALTPALSGEGYAWHGYRDHREPAKVQVETSDWVVSQLPGGFTMTHHQMQRLPSSKSAVEHYVFSDGLATVSVYIEEMAEGDVLEGLSSRGAVNAYGVMVDGHQITAVGVVPPPAVKLIGHSVQRRAR